MAKFERSAKGKKKKRIAAGFAIAFSVILMLEGIFLAVIWGGRASEKKKNAPVVISFGKQNPGREIGSEAAAIALNQYVYARLLEEKMVRFDENGDYEEFKALVDETEAAWATADDYAAKLETMGTALEAEETKDGYQDLYRPTKIAYLEEKNTPVMQDPFAIHAQAKGHWDKESIEWAQEIQDYYDRAPAGKNMRLLACVLKTDTAHAAIRFQQAQAILKGEAEIDEVNQTWHINNCKALSTTGKAAGTVVAIAATGGTVTVLSGAGILASGVDATVNFSATEASIRLGDEHHCTQVLDKVGEYTGMAAAITSFWGVPGSSTGEKILFGVGTFADATDGKLLGGVVDVDADGEVKLIGIPVREGANSKAERKAAFRKSINEFREKWKGKDIFVRNVPSEEKLDNLVDSLDDMEKAKEKGVKNTEVPLSEVSDDYLDIAIKQYKEKLDSWYNEGVEMMNWLVDQFNEALENGSLYVVMEEEEEYLYFPTVYDVAGAWDVNLTFNNMESELVNTIVRGIIEILPVDVDDPDAIIEDSVEYNNGASISGYMNIEPTGKNTARVTMYLYGDDGEMVTVVYSGKMNKQGMMSLKMRGYNGGGESGSVDVGFPNMEFDFYGIGEGRYTSGTYYLKSYTLNADIDYYGTRHHADEYWDFAGGGY
ncbi:MAG: hypothetical protein IKO32_02530 [Lachnospiraceae bacterium]|nr:hypothetical protein [Lachnospiraceae bacterium]